MPVADKSEPENFHEVERDPRDADQERDKSNKAKSSKSKDLSHVPCKFFKVGSCTAGSSCPFSHNVQEPGQQKDVCAWFVKGNCKFGHKCALAHILPGQSMAMDRKNKKSAQLAANGGGGGQGRDSSKGNKPAKRDLHSQSTQGSASSSSNARSNSLLSGSTAPTRMLQPSSRPPIAMSLKAPISPSAPAPPLKDTDFASFGLPDETNRLPSAPAQRKMSPETLISDDTRLENASYDEQGDSTKLPLPSLPLSTPSASRRLGLSHHSSGPADFGPIGSPHSPSSQPVHMNGFSPGTSPVKTGDQIMSSPFSAPGSQSIFSAHDQDSSLLDFKARSGVAASLGATRTWKTDLGPVPSQIQRRESGLGINRDPERDVVVEDEDLEEFLPSSLNELLTPEERSRRMSRTNSGRPSIANINLTAGLADTSVVVPRSGGDGPHHRYSRSVPANSLLGDIKSIWADHGNGLPGSPDAMGANSHDMNGSMLNAGTPSSFKSVSGFGGRSISEDVTSASMLSPSNASAAFLPGLHHYLNSKVAIQQRQSNARSVASTLFSSASGAATLANSNSNSNHTSAGVAFSPPHGKSIGNRALFDNMQSDPYFSLGLHRQSSGRPIPASNGIFAGDNAERHHAISPSTRALQAHAPGQSLPQGLAAGYSRIHALPPPPSVASASVSSAFSGAQSAAYSPGNSHDWASGALNAIDSHTSIQPTQMSSASGLESMFSRLSYSAAASRTSSQVLSGAGLAQSPPSGSPLGMARIASNNRSWQGQGHLSPLSGPVVTGDDDDLFSMDG